MELYESLGIIDTVMERSIETPSVRVYKGPEGTEISRDIVMVPVLPPTPAKPYVGEFKLVTSEKN